MYRIFFSLLVTALVYVAIPISGPTFGKATASSSQTVSSPTHTFEGLLVVREADGVFLIRSETGEKKRFKVNPNTTITRNGKPAAYGDLRSRDLIRVYYNADFVVTGIEATGS